MRCKPLAILLPYALALGACITATPAYRDSGTRNGPHVEGGLDNVVQKFYDTQIQNCTQSPAVLHPYPGDGLAQLLNDTRQDPANSKLLQTNLSSSSNTPMDSTVVASVSTIPNHDACNILLRAEPKQGTQSREDEVLMTQEGQCWVIDDVRYLGNNSHAPTGALRQSLEKRWFRSRSYPAEAITPVRCRYSPQERRHLRPLHLPGRILY